jgi:hypothetical protein
MNYSFDPRISECHYKRDVECNETIGELISKYPPKDREIKGLN